MASAALSPIDTTVMPFTDSRSGIRGQANELCEQLLAHMLDCDLCLDPEQPTCAVCMSLQNGIKAQGGASTGVVFAF